MLGYASERQLCMALSAQTGWPGIVLDESVIRLDVLEYVSLEWARIFSALVVYEDAQTLVIAAARPEDAIVPARELGAARGKNVELRIALDVTLARTIRVAFAKWKTGELFLAGPRGRSHRARTSRSSIPTASDDEHRRAQRALAEEAARNIERNDELPSEESRGRRDLDRRLAAVDDVDDATGSRRRRRRSARWSIVAELDRGEEPDTHSGRVRALVVDPDPPSRIQMVAQLEELGYECQAAATGDQAIELLAALYFELVFADIATPGARRAPAVPRDQAQPAARRGAASIVTTSVVDSGQVADEELQRHGADGYLEKPLDVAPPAPAAARSVRPRSAAITRRCSPTRSAATTAATSKARSAGCAARWSAIRRAPSSTSCSRTCCSARRAGPRPSTSTRRWSSSSRRTFRR